MSFQQEVRDLLQKRRIACRLAGSRQEPHPRRELPSKGAACLVWLSFSSQAASCASERSMRRFCRFPRPSLMASSRGFHGPLLPLVATLAWQSARPTGSMVACINGFTPARGIGEGSGISSSRPGELPGQSPAVVPWRTA